jgi:glycine oxidase
LYNNGMAQHPDVLILGGGVIGLTAAYFLASSGATVSILDRGDLGQESSWAGAGMIPPAPPLGHARHPFDLLAAHSARLHPILAGELRASTGVDNGYLQCGGWALFPPGEEFPVREWQGQGIVCEEADPREREPALDPGRCRAAYLPGMAQLRNPRHVKALIAWCGAHGVTMTPGCPVLGFEQTGGRTTGVKTACGPQRAEKVLLTAGAWSGSLLQEVGWQPGIRPVRGQIALLHTAPPVLRSVVEVGKRYLVPRPDGRVLVGATEEDAGFVKQTTAAGIAGLLEFAFSVVPALRDAPVERCWAGLRPGTPDGMPFIGKVPGCENLFVAAGHYRAGIQLSPATGLVVKELLLGEPTTIPLDAFRLDRAGA